jgi:hypothetical protein
MEVVGSSTTTVQLCDKEDKQNKGKRKHIVKSSDILKNHGGGSRSKEVVRRRRGRVDSRWILGREKNLSTNKEMEVMGSSTTAVQLRNEENKQNKGKTTTSSNL